MNKKVSVFCIWRDAEEHIRRTLQQLESIESLSGYDFSYYFYENDSKDNTVEILRKWIEPRNGSILSEKLSAPKFRSTTDIARMKFLCECRNKSKNLAKENNSSFSLLIDGDIEFSKENFIMAIEDIQNLPKAVMVTANIRQNIPDLTFQITQDSYYDVYPFFDRFGNQGMYVSDCPSFNKDDQFNWKLGIPILCCSAFGGFALLKSEIFNKVNWSSDVHCDHVNMCFDLRFYGAIYCNPRNKVYTTIDVSKLDLSVLKKAGESQRDSYFKYFNINSNG